MLASQPRPRPKCLSKRRDGGGQAGELVAVLDQPRAEEAVEPVMFGEMAGQRAQIAVRGDPLGGPPISAARSADARPARRASSAAICSHPFLRLERAGAVTAACRPAPASRPRRRGGCSCTAARRATSSADLRCGTSGWRRMAPVAVQGASSSTERRRARPGASAPRRRPPLRPGSASRARLERAGRAGAVERSIAVTWAPAATSCAVLPPGAAQRSTTSSPGDVAQQRSRQSRRRRPAPTTRPRRSPASVVIAPPAVRRSVPVGSAIACEPCRTNARHRRARVRSSGASLRCASAIARRHRLAIGADSMTATANRGVLSRRRVLLGDAACPSARKAPQHRIDQALVRDESADLRRDRRWSRPRRGAACAGTGAARCRAAACRAPSPRAAAAAC